MKRGQRFYHNHFISPADNRPQLIEVTSTKRFTGRDGADSTLVYWRPVIRLGGGRELRGALYYTDIRDTGQWKAETDRTESSPRPGTGTGNT